MKTQFVSMAIAATILAAAVRTDAFECKVCHSKNPKMVTMHKALEGANCFDCHKIGEKLMGKGPPKDIKSLLGRRTIDPNCLPCHAQPSTVKPAIPDTQPR